MGGGGRSAPCDGREQVLPVDEASDAEFVLQILGRQLTELVRRDLVDLKGIGVASEAEFVQPAANRGAHRYLQAHRRSVALQHNVNAIGTTPDISCCRS